MDSTSAIFSGTIKKCYGLAKFCFAYID